jgi:hypothetical protein
MEQFNSLLEHKARRRNSDAKLTDDGGNIDPSFH